MKSLTDVGSNLMTIGDELETLVYEEKWRCANCGFKKSNTKVILLGKGKGVFESADDLEAQNEQSGNRINWRVKLSWERFFKIEFWLCSFLLSVQCFYSWALNIPLSYESFRFHSSVWDFSAYTLPSYNNLSMSANSKNFNVFLGPGTGLITVNSIAPWLWCGLCVHTENGITSESSSRLRKIGSKIPFLVIRSELVDKKLGRKDRSRACE